MIGTNQNPGQDVEVQGNTTGQLALDEPEPLSPKVNLEPAGPGLLSALPSLFPLSLWWRLSSR